MKTVALCSFLLLLSCSHMLFAAASNPGFRSARPVWIAGQENELNQFAGFRAVFQTPKADRTVLRVATSGVYRAWLNGHFIGYGPARAAHDCFRIDEWDLTARMQPGANLVALEVAAANVPNYYIPKQRPFIQAEVTADGNALVATGQAGSAFGGKPLPERVRKVQRYTLQRTFKEVYRLTPQYDAWRIDPSAVWRPVASTIVPAVKLLPRRVPYPQFASRQPLRVVFEGTLQRRADSEPLQSKRSLHGVAPVLPGYRQEELERIPSKELESFTVSSSKPVQRQLDGGANLAVPGQSYRLLDFGTNLTGFLGGRVTCPKKTRFYLVFDEILSGEDVRKEQSSINIVSYELAPGTYNFETIEPYTLRYLKMVVLEGECRFERIFLREYANPDVYRAHFKSSDHRLNKLFAAGRETFRQNAVDIFMDCPSRERAGWLCDSYFTARVAPELTGDTSVEHAFLENFLLPERFTKLPECMLPMCYPADHLNGTFIPNWSLWFVLQLEEYQARTGDRGMVEAFRPKVMGLLDYFKRYRNDDGLLEKLDSWVFIEWSEANKFVQDVNYPSNMLYAGALEAAGRMYRDPLLVAEALKVRETIRRQSFDGQFFIDNAIRKEGKLEPTRNRSEVCQYFAFYFNVASPQTHPALWEALRDKFGPGRKESGAFPEVHVANAFIGNVLRLELLSRYGRSRQLLDESVSYLLYMAERTGTLWENVDSSASCNHGFASHVVHVLYRDVVGLRKMDTVAKEIGIRFTDLDLEWAEGDIPVQGGRVSVGWLRQGDKIIYRANAPAGYKISVEVPAGVTAVSEP